MTYDFDDDKIADYYSEELSFILMRVISYNPETDEIRIQTKQSVFERLINGSPVYEDALKATNNNQEVADWVADESPPGVIMDCVSCCA